MKKIFNVDNWFVESQTISSTKLICGWCDSVISPNRGYIVHSSKFDKTETGYIYICPNCKQIILYNKYNGEIFPLSKFGKEIKKLPNMVEKIYNEIRSCYSIGAFTSISLLGRKLLMHIAVEEGAEENKNFLYYVDYLNDNNYVPKKGKSLLDFLRTQGNESNHEVIIFKKEEAEKLISCIELILLFIYEYADQ